MVLDEIALGMAVGSTSSEDRCRPNERRDQQIRLEPRWPRVQAGSQSREDFDACEDAEAPELIYAGQ